MAEAVARPHPATVVDLDHLRWAHDSARKAEGEAVSWRTKRNEMIRQLRDRGVSVTEMADALNLSRKAVYLVLENDR